MPEDLYELLGVPATATAAEITRAYRRLARSLHPDACPGDPSAADRFARMTAAYRVLADPQQRAAYDRQRMAGGTVGPRLQGRRVPVTVVDDAATGSPFSTWPFVESPFSTSGYFAPATGVRRQRPAAQPSPRPGRDTTGELTLAFADAITGVSVTVESTRPGTPPHHVRIPPGIDDGQRLRIAGAGEPGRGGDPPGDLYLTVRVLPHPRFARRGNDLIITVPITFAEAVTGAELSIPGIDERPIRLHVPPGIRSGDSVRVPGAGVPASSGAGDLIATVVIDVPTTLTDAQRAAVDALAGQLPNPRAGGKEES